MGFFSKTNDGEPVAATLPQPASETTAASSGIPNGGGVAGRIAGQENGNPGNPGSPPVNPPTEKKRRGRPPVHGRYSKALGSDGKIPVKTPGPQSVENRNDAPDSAPRVGLPKDLVEKIVRESLNVLENTLVNAIDGKGKLAGLSTGEIEPQLNQAKLGEPQKKLVGELMPYAMREWGMSPELSPTAAIVVILGPWSFAGASAFLTLSKLAKEKHAREFPEPEKDKSGKDNPTEKGNSNGAMGS